VATDLNHVLLIGRLTRDPELKQTGTGTSYCRFGIANNRNYTQNGERKEEVSFFNCVAWGRQAEVINQYCRKGKQVAIEGRLKQNSWDGQDGKKQSSVDVVVESLQMLGSTGGGDGGSGSYSPQTNDASANFGSSSLGEPDFPVPVSDAGMGRDDFEDDVPF